MGVQTIMITGDNLLISAAAEAGVDDFVAQADVGIAMAIGTSAAREADNMVDLDLDPKKIIEIVKIGK